MKFLTTVFLSIVCLNTNAQETWEVQEGDTTYVMQQYFMCFLKAGPNRGQDSLEIAQVQEAHLAHLTKVYEDGKSCIAGPFGDDGDIRGIVIYNTATIEEADSLAKADPAVKAGRLTVALHPWWAAKGAKLK